MKLFDRGRAQAAAQGPTFQARCGQRRDHQIGRRSFDTGQRLFNIVKLDNGVSRGPQQFKCQLRCTKSETTTAIVFDPGCAIGPPLATASTTIPRAKSVLSERAAYFSR